jgi:hypothetical protein
LSMWVGDVERAERSLAVASDRGFASLPQLQDDAMLAPLRSSPGYARAREEIEKRHREATAAFQSAGGASLL